MKFSIKNLFVTSMLTSSIFAAEGWLTNVEEGVEKAKKENKIAFVEFTGSDWCPPCKYLRSQIFPTETFKKYAAEKFILIELDYPKDTTKISEENRVYNEIQRKKYAISGYPTIILLDKDGRPFALKVGGASTVEEYIQEIEKLIQKDKEKVAAFAMAEKLSGLEKAKKLQAGLEIIPEKLHSFYDKEVHALFAADVNDELGLRKIYNSQQQFVQQQKDFQTLRETLKNLSDNRPNANTMPPSMEIIKQMNNEVDKFLNRKDLLPLIRQEVLFKVKYSLVYALNRDINEIIPYLEEIVKIDSENKFGKSAKMVLENIQRNKNK